MTRRALALVLLLVPGCPVNPWDFDLPDVGGPSYTDTGYRPCTADTDLPTDASMDAADALLRSFEDGEVEVAMSPLGCHRYYRRIEGGQVVEASIRLQTDYELVGYDFVPVVVTVASWERGADGVLRGGVDADDREDSPDDTYFEHREALDPAARRIERTWWNEATDEISERLVIQVLPDDRIHRTLERRIDGVLTVVEDDVGSEAEESDLYPLPLGGGPTECAPTTCTPAETERLEGIFSASLHRRMTCFSTREGGRERAARYADLMIRWHSQHRFQCIPAGCAAHGQFDSESYASGGPVVISMQIGSASDPALTDTMIHELTHGVMGLHTEGANDMRASIGSATVDGMRNEDTDTRLLMMYRYSDPATACTEYCGTDTTFRNRCTCAACLGVRPCDSPCNTLPSCTLRNEMNMPLASEAIGTICEGDMPDTYFSTYANCMSSCAEGECRSLATQCIPGCR